MDQICIKKLEIFARHGVLPEENTLGQKFLVTATLYGDTSKAGRSDALEDSINYAEVSQLVKEITEKQVFKLIETLAEQIAEGILLAYPKLCKVDIEVEKPWAPVLLPLETVSVKIRRAWNQVYLGIGSNLGDKQKNLEEAIRLLQEDAVTEVVRQSSFITTAPVGYTEQDDFLNGALEIRTLRSPEGVLALIGEIETALKRERNIHWGPRTIDLDILLYNEEIIYKKDLIVPHIEMAKRSFVLEPLAEIAPYVMHPVLQKCIVTLKEELEKSERD